MAQLADAGTPKAPTRTGQGSSDYTIAVFTINCTSRGGSAAPLVAQRAAEIASRGELRDEETEDSERWRACWLFVHARVWPHRRWASTSSTS